MEGVSCGSRGMPLPVVGIGVCKDLVVMIEDYQASRVLASKESTHWADAINWRLLSSRGWCVIEQPKETIERHNELMCSGCVISYRKIRHYKSEILCTGQVSLLYRLPNGRGYVVASDMCDNELLFSPETAVMCDACEDTGKQLRDECGYYPFRAGSTGEFGSELGTVRCYACFE